MIKKYFKLTESIERSLLAIKRMEQSFYDQTLTCYTTVTDDELHIQSFNVEMNVNNLVDATEQFRKHIKDNQVRLKYFKRFLDELPKQERNQIIQKFVHSRDIQCNDIEEKALDEIREIETMINFMNGHPEEVRRIEREEDETEKSFVLKMCEMLGV